MIRLNRSSIVAALALMSVAEGAHAQPAEGDPVAGKGSWTRVGCYACHGYAGQGLDMTGPQLSGRAWTLPVFSQFIRDPPNVMPPYSPKVLTDREVRNLMAYVNSVQVKKR